MAPENISACGAEEELVRSARAPGKFAKTPCRAAAVPRGASPSTPPGRAVLQGLLGGPSYRSAPEEREGPWISRLHCLLEAERVMANNNLRDHLVQPLLKEEPPAQSFWFKESELNGAGRADPPDPGDPAPAMDCECPLLPFLCNQVGWATWHLSTHKWGPTKRLVSAVALLPPPIILIQCQRGNCRCGMKGAAS